MAKSRTDQIRFHHRHAQARTAATGFRTGGLTVHIISPPGAAPQPANNLQVVVHTDPAIPSVAPTAWVINVDTATQTNGTTSSTTTDWTFTFPTTLTAGTYALVAHAETSTDIVEDVTLLFLV